MYRPNLVSGCEPDSTAGPNSGHPLQTFQRRPSFVRIGRPVCANAQTRSVRCQKGCLTMMGMPLGRGGVQSVGAYGLSRERRVRGHECINDMALSASPIRWIQRKLVAEMTFGV